MTIFRSDGPFDSSEIFDAFEPIELTEKAGTTEVTETAIEEELESFEPEGEVEVEESPEGLISFDGREVYHIFSENSSEAGSSFEEDTEEEVIENEEFKNALKTGIKTQRKGLAKILFVTKIYASYWQEKKELSANQQNLSSPEIHTFSQQGGSSLQSIVTKANKVFKYKKIQIRMNASYILLQRIQTIWKQALQVEKTERPGTGSKRKRSKSVMQKRRINTDFVKIQSESITKCRWLYQYKHWIKTVSIQDLIGRIEVFLGSFHRKWSALVEANSRDIFDNPTCVPKMENSKAYMQAVMPNNEKQRNKSFEFLVFLFHPIEVFIHNSTAKHPEIEKKLMKLVVREAVILVQWIYHQYKHVGETKSFMSEEEQFLLDVLPELLSDFFQEATPKEAFLVRGSLLRRLNMLRKGERPSINWIAQIFDVLPVHLCHLEMVIKKIEAIIESHSVAILKYGVILAKEVEILFAKDKFSSSPIKKQYKKEEQTMVAALQKLSKMISCFAESKHLVENQAYHMFLTHLFGSILSWCQYGIKTGQKVLISENE